MFLGRPSVNVSVRSSVRATVRPGVRPVSPITLEQVDGFVDQILYKHSVPQLDKLVTFRRSWGECQGQIFE